MKKTEDNFLALFVKLVASHTGLSICLDDGETCRRAMSLQMKQLNIFDPGIYLSFLESGSVESTLEWKSLITTITTGESYFFRDMGHFLLLQNTILPELIKKNRIQRSLRIWSAGCAAGEEPYSIAILLDMLLPDLKEWEISITATDINEKSLEKAAHGIYSPWSFRMPGRDLQEKYFTNNQDEWKIHENIKKMVSFRYGNLADDAFYSHTPEICDMDLIICRNVFIYFDNEAVSSVLNKFRIILNDGGYLVTGHTELYGHDLTGLRQIMFPEAVIYKKNKESEVIPVEISRVPEFITAGKILKRSSSPAVTSVLPGLELNKKSIPDPQRGMKVLIDKGRYPETIEMAENLLITNNENFELLYLLARGYADAGDYEKATQTNRRAMNSNAESADLYFLQAQVEDANGNNVEAMELFKKAIYLDPGFIAAYYELGGLYEKERDIPRAKKNRTTAIEFLKTLPSGSPVKPYNVTAEELLEYIEDLTKSKEVSS